MVAVATVTDAVYAFIKAQNSGRRLVKGRDVPGFAKLSVVSLRTESSTPNLIVRHRGGIFLRESNGFRSTRITSYQLVWQWVPFLTSRKKVVGRIAMSDSSRLRSQQAAPPEQAVRCVAACEGARGPRSPHRTHLPSCPRTLRPTSF